MSPLASIPYGKDSGYGSYDTAGGKKNGQIDALEFRNMPAAVQLKFLKENRLHPDIRVFVSNYYVQHRRQDPQCFSRIVDALQPTSLRQIREMAGPGNYNAVLMECVKYLKRQKGSCPGRLEDIHSLKVQVPVEEPIEANQAMKNKVAEITRGLNTQEEKLMAIREFVYKNIWYEQLPEGYKEMPLYKQSTDKESFGHKSAREVWEYPRRSMLIFFDKAGICGELANTTITLCRLAGLDANYVSKPRHAIVQVKIGDKALYFDPRQPLNYPYTTQKGKDDEVYTSVQDITAKHIMQQEFYYKTHLKNDKEFKQLSEEQKIVVLEDYFNTVMAAWHLKESKIISAQDKSFMLTSLNDILQARVKQVDPKKVDKKYLEFLRDVALMLQYGKNGKI